MTPKEILQEAFSPVEWREILNQFEQRIQAPLLLAGPEGEVISESTGFVPLEFVWKTQRPLLEFHERPFTVNGQHAGMLVAKPAHGDGGELEVLAQSVELCLRLFARDYSDIESLSKELLDRYEEIALLYDLSDALRAVFSLDDIRRIVLEKSLKAVPSHKAVLLLLDDKTQELAVAAASGLTDRQQKAHFVTDGSRRYLSELVFVTGKSALVSSWEDVPAEWLSPLEGDDGVEGGLSSPPDYESGLENLSSPDRMEPGLPSPLDSKSGLENPPSSIDPFLPMPLIYAPLHVKNRRIGVVGLAEKQDGSAFTSGDLKLLTAIASLAAITIHNSQLMEQVRLAERAKRETEIAENIQRRFLPESFPSVPGAEICGNVISASNVGGDYIDHYLGANGQLYLLMTDVVGQNVGAALMMLIARTVFKTILHHLEHPRDILESANQLLYHDLEHSELLLRALVANYHPRTHKFCFASAGHEMPLHWRAKHRCVEQMECQSMLIGIQEQNEPISMHVTLEPGDMIVLYSDGLVEIQNNSGERFGFDRLRACLERHHNLTASQLTILLVNEVRAFSQNIRQRDDISIVVLKVTETGAVLACEMEEEYSSSMTNPILCAP